MDSIKRYIHILLASIFITFLFGGYALLGSMEAVHAQLPQKETTIQTEEIEYTLPYAGLLPDSPLYFIKRTRDAFWLFFTRDSGKKAEILLLFADKKIVMAQALSEKGKWKLALETIEASQKDVDKLINAVDLSTKIGSALSEDFLDTVRLSSTKHLEIMEDMLKNAPDESRTGMEELMQKNVEQYNRLQKL
jgi:hypothetical protein